MQVFIVVAALVAVAASAPSAVIGPVGNAAVVRGPQAVLAGPSATLVADTGAIVSGGVSPAVVGVPSVSSVVSHGVVAPGLIGLNHGLLGLNHGLVGVNGLGLVGLNGLYGGHGLIYG